MKKILIINANYYYKISHNLNIGAKKILKENNFKFNIINVPGVFEIPFAIRRNVKKFDAFIAIGCVIKGDTPHFDLISKACFDGLIKISIDFNKPVSNGIITANNMGQAIKRSSLTAKNVKPNKGYEAAKAIISLLKNG